MIDEKMLIEILSRNSIFEKITNAEGKNIYEIIDSLPKVGDWIPCSERLPKRKNRTKISETVIATYLSMFDKRPLCDAFVYYDYDENIWLWDDNDEPVAVDIVAWQPLPEPYKPPQTSWQESMMKHFTKVE